MVGKVTPKGDTASGPEEKLLRSIFGEKAIDVTDTSLKMPSGSGGIVVDVRVFNRHGIEKDERSITIERSEIELVQEDRKVEEEILNRNIKFRAIDLLNGQSISKQFKNLISNCRTFGFKEEVDSLRKKGLIAGGSLDNAIVLDKKGIVNNDKLRQENEFVKHKILDFIGDIYLLGYSVKGAFEIYKGGHRLTHETMNSIMSDQSNWRLINEDNLNDKNYQKTYYTKSVAASL